MGWLDRLPGAGERGDRDEEHQTYLSALEAHSNRRQQVLGMRHPRR